MKFLNAILTSVQGEGNVVYIISWPTAQESLNPTISKNALILANDVAPYPHLLIDNERQVQLLRGKVGILNMYPVANSTFAKLFHQVLKLASEKSYVQTFDSKDLGRCLGTRGAHVSWLNNDSKPSRSKIRGSYFSKLYQSDRPVRYQKENQLRAPCY